jgi:membrane protein implicated in regulation of membrane protease activity
MRRIAVAVLVMEAVALGLAVAVFGWAVLVVGAPVLLATALVLAVIAVSAEPRRRLRDHRASRFDPATAEPGGLMSGFFELPR